MVLSWWSLVAVAAADPVPLLAEELDAAMAHWSAQGEAPHHVAVALTDTWQVRVWAQDGALGGDTTDRERALDVDLRMGSPELDSTHPLRSSSAWAEDDRELLWAPYDAVEPGVLEPALRHAVREELGARWRTAREHLTLVEAEARVRVAEEDPAPDFEPRAPEVGTVEVAPLSFDRAAWAEVIVPLSAQLNDSDVVVESTASVEATRRVVSFVDTEGTRLSHGRTWMRVALSATAVADDGDRVTVYRTVDVRDPSTPPDAFDLAGIADGIVSDVAALRDAPRVDTYTGPVVLSGRAAAVFVHEVLGHRAEAQRNKRDDASKTFTKMVGQPILPPFLDVVDDPTLATTTVPTDDGVLEVDLPGFYRWDDEGVAAQRAVLVDDGIYQGFLMGRSPLPDVPHSNGHGRRSPGHAPVARMGNTILEASEALPEPALRRAFLAELKRQGLDFGYWVDDIGGGFTMTGRVTPNAFNVRATRVRRVWADGRPDELVRGIDLVGTPRVAFLSILAAGTDVEVFHGFCGAESGWVPVSGVAPPLLFRQLEFQLKEKESAKPPLRAKPGRDALVEAP